MHAGDHPLDRCRRAAGRLRSAIFIRCCQRSETFFTDTQCAARPGLTDATCQTVYAGVARSIAQPGSWFSLCSALAVHRPGIRFTRTRRWTERLKTQPRSGTRQ